MANNLKKEDKKQCPICGRWDVYREYIIGEEKGDWCPHCKQSVSPNEISKNIRPWVRYWARFLDNLLILPIIALLFGISDSYFTHKIIDFLHKTHVYLFYIFCVISEIFVEAALLSTWGYTPGKWLLKVKVRDVFGEKITYIKALKRAVSVFIFGLGGGIPILSIFTLATAYKQLTNDKITIWDKKGCFVVTHRTIGFLRAAVAIVLIIGLNVMSIILEFYTPRANL